MVEEMGAGVDGECEARPREVEWSGGPAEDRRAASGRGAGGHGDAGADCQASAFGQKKAAQAGGRRSGG